MIKPTSSISQSIVLTLGIFLAAASVAIAPVVAEAQQVKKGKKGNKGKKANKGGKKQAGKKKAGKTANKNAPSARKKKVVVNKTTVKKPRLEGPRTTSRKRVQLNHSLGRYDPLRAARNAGWQGSPRKVIRVPEPVYKKQVIRKRNRPAINKRDRGNGRIGNFDDIRHGKKFRRNIHRNLGFRHNKERRQRRVERRLKRKILRALDRWF